MLKQLREDMEKIPGIVSADVYKLDSDPNEYFMAVAFENKDKYWANAKSPEQDARYRKISQYFARDPEWFDGEVTHFTKDKPFSIR
jgi:hypothetical protein